MIEFKTENNREAKLRTYSRSIIEYNGREFIFVLSPEDDELIETFIFNITKRCLQEAVDRITDEEGFEDLPADKEEAIAELQRIEKEKREKCRACYNE